MERIFDICHDCRKAVDQCCMWDLYFMTKCPYTPPHEWALDFPHTMLRAKAIKFKKGEVSASEKFLASTDVHGQCGQQNQACPRRHGEHDGVD